MPTGHTVNARVSPCSSADGVQLIQARDPYSSSKCLEQRPPARVQTRGYRGRVADTRPDDPLESGDFVLETSRPRPRRDRLVSHQAPCLAEMLVALCPQPGSAPGRKALVTGKPQGLFQRYTVKQIIFHAGRQPPGRLRGRVLRCGCQNQQVVDGVRHCDQRAVRSASSRAFRNRRGKRRSAVCSAMA